MRRGGDPSVTIPCSGKLLSIRGNINRPNLENSVFSQNCFTFLLNSNRLLRVCASLYSVWNLVEGFIQYCYFTPSIYNATATVLVMDVDQYSNGRLKVFGLFYAIDWPILCYRYSD